MDPASIMVTLIVFIILVAFQHVCTASLAIAFFKVVVINAAVVISVLLNSFVTRPAKVVILPLTTPVLLITSAF